jgi:hypothetical protein
MLSKTTLSMHHTLQLRPCDKQTQPVNQLLENYENCRFLVLESGDELRALGACIPVLGFFDML